MGKIIKLSIALILLFLVGCGANSKDYKKIISLLSVDSAKSDLINDLQVDFNKISYLYRTYKKDFLGENAFYGKTTFYHKGKVIYHSHGVLTEVDKNSSRGYSFLEVNYRDLGKGIFYHKGKIYFLKALGKEFPPTGDFFLAEYSIENGKGQIKELHDLRKYGMIGDEHFGLEDVKVHTCVNEKLYISANLTERGKKQGEQLKTVFLLYNLKTNEVKKVGDYDFTSYFRIVYAGSKAIVVTDMYGIYAIDLSNGKIIYEKKVDLMSPLIYPTRKAVLYNRAVYYEKALYLIIPIKKEKATKIIRIDENGEKVVAYFPSTITLVAREGSKIFFVKAPYLLDPTGGYRLNKPGTSFARVIGFDLKTKKQLWERAIEVKVGGGLGAPLLTKKKVIVCLGGKIVILNRFTGTVLKTIPLKGHFSARLSYSENRITTYGKDNTLLIGEIQKKIGKKYKKITFWRNGKRTSYYVSRKKKSE